MGSIQCKTFGSGFFNASRSLLLTGIAATLAMGLSESALAQPAPEKNFKVIMKDGKIYKNQI
jgi:hypothetical protein